MVRVPRGLHTPAGAYARGKLQWGPVAWRAQVVAFNAWTYYITGVPLIGGQAQGTISIGGSVTSALYPGPTVFPGPTLHPGATSSMPTGTGGECLLSVGPSGAGTVWFPAAATVSTTSGINDNSTCNLYIGPAGIPITLVGTLFPGGYGTISLPIPSLAPGQYIIAVWTGGKLGDVASINISGTMQALAPG